MKRTLYVLLLCAVFSCGSGERPQEAQVTLPSETEVADFYNLYVHGDYAGFVAAMASCDGLPEDYRQQMATLYKQHAAAVKQDRGGVKAFKVGRMEAHNDSIHVNAFLNLTYQDGSSEEIMLPLVRVGGKWRLQ